MDYVSTNPVVALAAGTVIVAAVFVAGEDGQCEVTR